MENIQRINGFINLDELFKSSKCALIDWEIDENMYEEYKGTNIKYVFLYNNEKWIYKNLLTPFNCYAELIAEELATCFSIPNAHYDLAISNEYGSGVITKNYKKTNANYLNGYNILANYIKDILKVKGIYNLEEKIKSYNSLQGIWASLEYRYINYPNKIEIVKSLMDQIVNIFIFDLLMANADRHELNWGIVEEQDKIYVQPLYDNERILIFDSDIRLLPHIDNESSFNSEYESVVRKMVLEFITISGSEYLDWLKEKLFLINKENIEKIFSKVEIRINFSIPLEIKNDILIKFEKITEIIDKVLEEYENKRNNNGEI